MHAACCGPNMYKIAAGSATVYVNGKPLARMQDDPQLRRIPVTCLTSPGRFAWDLFRLRWFHGA